MDFFRKLQADLTMNHICTLLIGILLLISPFTTSTLLVLIAGILIAVNGLCDLLANVFQSRTGVVTAQGSLASGIVRLILGIYMMSHTDTVLSLVSVIFAIYLIADGIMGLSYGQGESGMLQIILHVLLIVAGVIMLFNPIGTISTAVSICGVILIVDAVIGILTVQKFGRF